MLNINIICVGKIKESFFRDAINEYSKRLSKYCILNIIEIPDEKIPTNPSEKEIISIKNKEGQNINVGINLLKKKAYVKTIDKQYKDIYDVYPRKFIKPTGQLYQNNERAIINHLEYILDKEDNKTKLLELIENGKKYIMTIKSNNELISEDEIISCLLDDYENYNTVRDIFLAIIRIFNIYDIDLKLTDSLGSCIIIKNGDVEKYQEIQEKGNDYQKIYLENDNFYVEKKVIGEYRDEVTSLIKKLGEKNGKEKRKN